jgi:uncharacterized LabA/DUF88 family protein
MSQTPLDTSATNNQTNNQSGANSGTEGGPGGNGANGADQQAGPPRRRHRRAPQRHREPAAEPATTSEPQAAAVAPAEQAPETPAAGATDERAAAQAGTRGTTGRRGTRRPTRPRSPQLIRRGGAEDGEAAPTETLEADTIAAELAREVDDASRETVDASGVSEATASAAADSRAAEETFEANIETVRVDVADAQPGSEEQPASQPRRYRFDRRAPVQRPASTLRPERITGAFGGPLPTEPQDAAEPEQTAETPAQPAGETENLLDLAMPISPTGTELPHDGEREGLPAPDAYDAGAPLDDLASGEEVSGAFEESGEEGEAVGQGADEAGGAPRRRRRRRRNGSTIRHLEAVGVGEAGEEEPTPLPRGGRQRESEPEEPLYGGYPSQPTAPSRTPSNGGTYADGDQPYQMYAPFQQQQDESWNVSQAYEQMRQPRSPFGAPEPNTPRGFGQQPQGIATPYQERSLRSTRNDRQMDVPPISPNQLGSIITSAIQQQTDRLLAEMRHTQAPPSMTVMFPPLPSTERVAVFVDVANLLYSSRNLRVAIDFGRLLEFLRGNRRLVRAHAYAPTSPEPHAEQQFLAVVKGVGYRITTKNYKTFSSGAKKADLDLDMCMDIVRMVDAKAVDSVVLVSGDSDFLPLLEYCSDHGVRVEVAAFEDAAAAILRQSCDLFINLSLVDDIRA